MNPTLAFVAAIALCTAWLAGMAGLGRLFQSTPPTQVVAHVLVFLMPFCIAVAFQAFATRHVQLPGARRAVQIVAAGITAPLLAWALLWFVWAVALGHGE